MRTAIIVIAFFVGFFGAVIVGVIVTKSAWPLWFLTIFGFIDISFGEKEVPSPNKSKHATRRK